MRLLAAFQVVLQKAIAVALVALAWVVTTVTIVLILAFQFLRRPVEFFSSRPTKELQWPSIPDMESVFVQTSRLVLHTLRGTKADPEKPLMLFLHGFPENAYSWRNQLTYFQDKFTVVSLDMRGFGASDAPNGLQHYSMDVLCLDVMAVIKACGYQSCVLVGHDWGGMVAWNVAANFPNAVDALVTLCSPHPLAYSEPACFTSTQARRSIYFLLFATSWLPELYLSYCRGREIRKMMLSTPMGVVNVSALVESDVQFYIDALLRPGRLTAGLNYYRNAMFTSSLRAKKFVERTTSKEGWSGPTLQLYADTDGAFESSMFENCSVLTKKKNVSIVRLDGCSHWAQQDQPARVNAEIERFVSALQFIVSA